MERNKLINQLIEENSKLQEIMANDGVPPVLRHIAKTHLAANDKQLRDLGVTITAPGPEVN